MRASFWLAYLLGGCVLNAQVALAQATNFLTYIGEEDIFQKLSDKCKQTVNNIKRTPTSLFGFLTVDNDKFLAMDQ